MSKSHLTGANWPVRFGDRELLFSPLDDIGISELDNWVQSQYIRTARESLPLTATKEERQETLDIAMRTAAGLSAFSGMGARMLARIDGMARLVWQCCKTNHPDIKPEQLRAYMFNPEYQEIAREAFKQLNMQPATRQGAPPGKKQPTRTIATRRLKKKKSIER